MVRLRHKRDNLWVKVFNDTDQYVHSKAEATPFMTKEEALDFMKRWDMQTWDFELDDKPL